MSRFNSDLDFYESVNGPDAARATASCQDCGADIVPSTNPCCDGCSDRRERWAELHEIKRIAKAVLDVDLTKVKEIA